MKNLVTRFLSIAVLLTLPGLAFAEEAAKGKKDGLQAGGKVTAVTETSITVQHGKKDEGKTITVPAGTAITDDAGNAVPLADLTGKRVKVTESAPGTAQSISVMARKGPNKKK